MKFDELDKKLRDFELGNDYSVPSKTYMIARLDGRGFTQLTKERNHFLRPFDEKFRDMMIETVKHLMRCGFNVIYGYTQSDEISLLFDFNESTFSRKIRKFNSILAGEASAKFSLLLNGVAVFDCRISELPETNDVVDYFRWRSEDANRNALNAHYYWQLRNQGMAATEATKEMKGKSVAYKMEFLNNNSLDYNEIANWQKWGVGIYWSKFEKEGWNPSLNKSTIAIRRELKIDMNLPSGKNYTTYINQFLNE